MIQVSKQVRRFILGAGLLVVPGLALAADPGAKGQGKGSGQQSKAAAMQSSPMNVEQLNDIARQRP